jgi:hypothetical protein
MNKTTKTLGIVILAATVAGSGLIAKAAQKDMPDVPLTLTGCVVAGQTKDSYLLTNVVVDGSAAVPVNAYYRFNTTKGLKDQVGHRVEVRGKADLDDIDKGKLEVKAKDGKMTTSVTSERRTVKADEKVWGGSEGAMEMKADIATYKFEVDNIKRLEGNCANASAAR